MTTTAGCFIGIALGDVLGEYIITRNLENLDQLISEGASLEVIQRLYYHHGVFIWLVTIVVAFAIGLIADMILKKQKRRYNSYAI